MARNSIATFPDRMRELREGKGLTRDQLAVTAGTSSHSVSKLEQGIRAPSLELAWRIAKALGCSLDELVQPAGTTYDKPRGRPAKQPAADTTKPAPKRRGRTPKE